MVVERMPRSARVLRAVANVLRPGAQVPGEGESLNALYLTHLEVADDLAPERRLAVFRAILAAVYEHYLKAPATPWHMVGFADFNDWSFAPALRGYVCYREPATLYPIEARLARFLLSAIQLQSPGAKGDSSRLSLDMSQGELALLLGASRPKVNKALATLEEAAAVRRNGAELICDLEMLRAYAATE